MKLEQLPPRNLSDYEILQERVTRILGRRSRRFELAISEYPSANILDIESSVPVFGGPVRLRVDYWRVSNRPVCSQVIQDPSWRQILLEVDAMLSDNNSDYIFLEGLTPGARGDDGVLDVELVFGS
jgi:hypothetical protein